MNLGLGTVVTRRILFILALLLPFLMFGVKGLAWFEQKEQALALAREDANKIDLAALGPKQSALMSYGQAATVIADEAADNRAQNGCDWQRDTRLTLVFDATGMPLREPDSQGAVVYPGGSVPGISQGALVKQNAQSGPLRSDVSLPIRAKDAACLADGTAVGVLERIPGGAFAALRLIAFDWAGYRELLIFAYGALLIFWFLAELVGWRFNIALNRSISRITAVLKTVERNGFSERVPLDGGPEFALLGEEINAMIFRVGLAHRYFADLNGFVAHNLRSPLTVARTLVGSLSQTSGANASFLLSELDLRLLELDKRCRELLDRAKLETAGSVRSDPVDFAAVVRQQVEDIFSYLARDRDMDIDAFLAPAMVAMPSAAQELIIDNLLQNALKFGKRGTSIRIDLEARDGKAQLCVFNHGPSVLPDDFEAIFKRGVTTGGHGLGLYAVRTAVTLYGGEVTALPESEGFRILVTLPLARI